MIMYVENSAERKSLTGRITGFPDLLMGAMKQYEASLKCAASRVSFDVYNGIVASFLNIDEFGKDK